MIFPLPPPPFGTSGVSLTPRNVVAVSEAPGSLVQQSYQWPGQRWEIEAQYPPMPRDRAEAMVGWLSALQGRMGTFCFGDTSNRFGRGKYTKSGINLSYVSSPSANTMVLYLPANTYTGYVVPDAVMSGDYMQFGGINVLHSRGYGINNDSGSLSTWSQTDMFGLANGASRVTGYLAGSRIMNDILDNMLFGGMLSIAVRPSVNSKWYVGVNSSIDSLLCAGSPQYVQANTWQRLFFPLTNEVFLDALQPSVLVFDNNGYTISGSTLIRTKATTGNFDAAVVTKQSWFGGCRVDGTPAMNNADQFIGLTAVPSLATQDYGLHTFVTLRHAWYLKSDGTCSIYENGGLVGAIGSYIAGDVFTITYDGQSVVYNQNGVLKYRSSIFTGGLRFYGMVTSAQLVSQIKNFSFVSQNQPVMAGTSVRAGAAFLRMYVIGDTNCTADIGCFQYDPSGGLQYVVADTTLVPPQGKLDLYKLSNNAGLCPNGIIPGIWPNQRRSYTASQQVFINNPRAVFRLAGEHSWDVDTARIYGLSLRATEVL